MSDDLTAWLRGQVQARLELAREASPHSDGHWWRRTTDLSDGGPPEPVGHLYGGEQVFDTDGELFGGEFIVVYDEGAPSDAQFDLMAANDPRDTIARCEAELAILDEHAPYDPASEWLSAFCRRCGEIDFHRVARPCRTVRLIGSAYRHRDGYREEWKP